MRRLFIALAALCAALSTDLWNGAFADMPTGMNVEPGEVQVAESYLLPITPPLDQGDSDLCWVYATLSMLETNYMVRHPGSQITLSRGALERDAIEDRFLRLIRGEPRNLENGGLAVEALALIRQNGLLAEGDFHHVLDDPDPIFSAIEQELARYADPAGRRKALDEALKTTFGAKPPTTHLDGDRLSPAEFARAVLGQEHWAEFDLARHGVEGWGPPHDPDARPETRVMYVKLDQMIDLIHRSLARGEAVVWGSEDHALMIYGGEYAKDGTPLSYWIKDSLAPYTYRAGAETIHRELNDVTVVVDRLAVEPQQVVP